MLFNNINNLVEKFIQDVIYIYIKRYTYYGKDQLIGYIDKVLYCNDIFVHLLQNKNYKKLRQLTFFQIDNIFIICITIIQELGL